MNLVELAMLAREVRLLRKIHSATRLPADLKAAKKAERRLRRAVDKILDDIESDAPSLFGKGRGSS